MVASRLAQKNEWHEYEVTWNWEQESLDYVPREYYESDKDDTDESGYEDYWEL